MKAIPFRCKFGHVIIEECRNPTPTSITCPKCLFELSSGRTLIIDRKYVEPARNDIRAYRF